MRVLLLTKNFPPRSCGVGDFASRLAEELVAVGDTVSVLTEPAGEPRHISIGLRELPLGGWPDLRPVLDAIAASAPDLVQLEYAGYAWGRWGAAWWVNALLYRLRRRGIPVHLGLHELAISMRQHPLQAPAALAQWFHIALLTAASDTVAVNMRSRAALLARLFPWWRAKLRYRPNPSNIAVVPISPAERDALRRERGVIPGDTLVATFGMFHPAKNYEAVIRALAQLRRVRPARLWMLGNAEAASPEYLARLTRVAKETGVEDAVWWSGRLEAAAVSRALQAADVFVLPQPDGHLTRSGAFMAAAAHALPVIAVRQPGGRDQAEFTHGEHLWLAERSTTEDLSAGIQALLDDRTGAIRMGRNLQRLYETRFDWPIAIARDRGANAQVLAPGADAVPAHTETAVTATHAGGAKS